MITTTAPPPWPKRLRWWLGAVLHGLSSGIDSANNALFMLAYWLSEGPEDTPEEKALRDAQAEGNLQQILVRARYPCPECHGNRYVLVPDGYVRCDTCKGTGIDPKRADNLF